MLPWTAKVKDVGPARDVDVRGLSGGVNQAGLRVQVDRYDGSDVDPASERSPVGSVPDRGHPVIDSNGEREKDSKRFGTVRTPKLWVSQFLLPYLIPSYFRHNRKFTFVKQSKNNLLMLDLKQPLNLI
jgi:hypothetical protein